MVAMQQGVAEIFVVEKQVLPQFEALTGFQPAAIQFVADSAIKPQPSVMQSFVEETGIAQSRINGKKRIVDVGGNGGINVLVEKIVQ